MDGSIEVLLDMAKSKNMELTLNDNGTLKVSFHGEPDKLLIQALRDNKVRIIEYLRRQDTRSTPDYNTAEDVIRAIYEGTFRGAALIPVLPDYQEILGQACWVCAKMETAAKKRHTEQELVFTVEEFKVIVETALQEIEGLQSVVNVKRAFNGVIGVA
jgi:hypothetical protein